jgi:hypothetical protein
VRESRAVKGSWNKWVVRERPCVFMPRKPFTALLSRTIFA